MPAQNAPASSFVSKRPEALLLIAGAGVAATLRGAGVAALLASAGIALGELNGEIRGVGRGDSHRRGCCTGSECGDTDGNECFLEHGNPPETRLDVNQRAPRAMIFIAGPSGRRSDLRIDRALRPVSLDRCRPCHANHSRSPSITFW